MHTKDPKQTWEKYRTEELAAVAPLLERLGFTLDERQKHLGGERYLMRAVTTTSGQKLILTGRRASDGMRVVIKATRDAAGARELVHERGCRRVLQNIHFAYDVFHAPKEILLTATEGFTLSIQEYVKQEWPFLERPLQEQFAFALRAFKAQESAHAATYNHLRLVQKTFDTKDAAGYLRMFTSFGAPAEAGKFLETHEETIEQYCGFLTHTDFVPHNFRIAGDTMYLLDHSSLRFGNKYEGWARFLNFMTLYNPALEAALVQYVDDNRSPEESLSLRLMRVYRLGEIIWYYKNTLLKSTGNLLQLNQARVDFWSQVLDSQLCARPLADEVRASYIKTRDALRSEDEKERQVDLH